MVAPAPTPPEKTLQRVTLFSLVNGWSVVIVAGLGGMIALALGDWLSVGLAALIAGLGWLEVHGSRRLRRRDPAGMQWLIRSQLLLLALILAYCTSRLASFDSETVLGNLTPEMEAVLKENGIQRADVVPLVRMVFIALYTGVGLASILYQGGLALYYRSRTPTVTAALATPPPAEPPLA